MINEELKQEVMGDLVLLSLVGIKVVLVHGGGPEITETLNKIGKESQFVDGLRVTDKETADVVQMVLAGKINKSLVNLIQIKGGKFTLGKNTDSGAQVFYESTIAEGYTVEQNGDWYIVK